MGEPQAIPRRGGPKVGEAVGLLETTVSPFHCLYRDAFELHNQSRARLAHSAAEASRLARASLLLYLASAEALVHQAAVELGRPDLSKLVADANRPLSLLDVWRLLPAIASDGPAPASADPESPPWPQFGELLALRASWTHPGPADSRRAYYVRSPRGDFDPIEPHLVPPALSDRVPASRVVFPKTGFPRDPYAFAPRHLDTARAVLDAAIAALDSRLGGALTRGNRHRAEPTRMIDG